MNRDSEERGAGTLNSALFVLKKRHVLGQQHLDFIWVPNKTQAQPFCLSILIRMILRVLWRLN